MKQKEFFLNSLNFCFAHEEEIVCFLFTSTEDWEDRKSFRQFHDRKMEGSSSSSSSTAPQKLYSRKIHKQLKSTVPSI